MDVRYWLGRLQARAFPALERRGFHLTPVDYYQPIPDTRALPAEVWERRSELVGVDLREAEQLSLAQEFGTRYGAECARMPRSPSPAGDTFYFGNGWFDSLDAELLYGMIRHHKPRRVVEIGSGFSTLIAAEAARVNATEDGHATEIIAIEPYPRPFVTALAGERWRLISEPLQNLPMSLFTDLGQDDILFIDSSHVVRIGGDVVREYLEIVPRLAPGVIVHVHDIFFPFDYPREWVLGRRRFWTEQYLLQSFLAFNTEFEVLASASLLHADHGDAMAASFSSYPPSDYRPASFWMRRLPAASRAPDADRDA